MIRYGRYFLSTRDCNVEVVGYRAYPEYRKTNV